LIYRVGERDGNCRLSIIVVQADFGAGQNPRLLARRMDCDDVLALRPSTTSQAADVPSGAGAGASACGIWADGSCRVVAGKDGITTGAAAQVLR
jgi:hypothetical protein